MVFTKLDKYLFRFVCLLMITVLVLAIGSIIIGSYNREPDKQHQIKQVNKATKEEEALGLGTSHVLKKLKLVVIPLTVKTSGSGYGSWKYKKDDYRNLYVIDQNTGLGQWIFNDNSTVITQYSIECEYTRDCDNKSDPGFFIRTVPSDSNQDSKINDEDQKNLLYYSFEDKKIHTIETNIDFIFSIDLLSNGKTLITFAKNKTHQYYLVDPKNLESIQKKEIKI